MEGGNEEMGEEEGPPRMSFSLVSLLSFSLPFPLARGGLGSRRKSYPALNAVLRMAWRKTAGRREYYGHIN